MTENEQIEEMANIIFESSPIPSVWRSDATKFAESLYNAGYRKASEVAKEIFEEIDREICLALESNYKARNRRQMIVIPHGSSTFDREFIEYVSGKIDALRGINDFFAELKKKYGGVTDAGE